MKQNINVKLKKRKRTGLKHFNDSKAFIEYSNDMDGIYKSIEKYNPNKKRKILFLTIWLLILLSNKKLNPIVTELFIRSRKLNISLCFFFLQSYFPAPKSIKLNSAHYFIMEIPNKQELQQTAFNHSSDIDYKVSTSYYKNVLPNHIPF